MDTYTGKELAVDLPISTPPGPDSLFDLRPASVPDHATPIFDDAVGAVIGYCHEIATGVFRLYDLDGRVVGMDEKGLETPPVGPLDLIFVAGGIARAILKGLARGAGRSGSRAAALAGSKLSARGLSISVLGVMRVNFRRLSIRRLRFTATTAARMATPFRHVPVHILHLAIKHGRRTPDLRGVDGAFVYTTKMVKNGVSARSRWSCANETGPSCISTTTSTTCRTNLDDG